MNSKKFTEAMSKIDNKYVGEALFYSGTRLAKKSSKRIAALVAAIIAVFSCCHHSRIRSLRIRCI